MSNAQPYSLTVRHAFYNGSSPIPLTITPDPETSRALLSVGGHLKAALGSVSVYASELPDAALQFQLTAEDPYLYLCTTPANVGLQFTARDDSVQTEPQVLHKPNHFGSLTWYPQSAPKVDIALNAPDIRTEYVIFTSSKSINLTQAWLSGPDQTTAIPLATRKSQQIAGRDALVLVPQEMWPLRQNPEDANQVWLHFQDDTGAERHIILPSALPTSLRHEDGIVTVQIFVQL